MSGPEHRLLAVWRSEVERHIVGDPAPVTELMLTLLAGGHALLESAPWVGENHIGPDCGHLGGFGFGAGAMHPRLDADGHHRW